MNEPGARAAGPLHRFRGAFSGSAAFRIPPNEAVAYNVTDALGTHRVVVQTRHEPFGDESKFIPRELVVEVAGPDVSLDDFILHAHEKANNIASILTFAMNGATDVGVQPNLLFDICEEHSDHQFFQNVLPAEQGVPRVARNVDIPVFQDFLRDLLTHPDAERLLRAIGQYEVAIRSWHPGGELIALAHLFIAMEVLTPLVRRTEERAAGGPQQLADLWNVTANRCPECGHPYGLAGLLDAEVRRRVLFRGEQDVYAAAKRASDGFEHGFLPVPEMRAHAQEQRARLAYLVRHAIFDLISRDAAWRNDLLTANRDVPVPSSELTQYLRTTLTGSVNELPEGGNIYPYFDVTTEIADVRYSEGTWEVDPHQTITAHLGDGVTCGRIKMEYWTPAPKLGPPAGSSAEDQAP